MKRLKLLIPLLLVPLLLCSCGLSYVPLLVVTSLLSSSPEEIDIECTDVAYTAPVLPADKDTTDYSFEVENFAEDPLRPHYNRGTNRRLEGDVVVAIFFVDDDESIWDADEITEFTDESILPALDFLEKEADRWEIELDFTVWRYSSDFTEGLTLTYEGTVIKDLDTSPTGSTKDMMDQVAADMGYASNMALHAALTEQAEGREVIPLFFINKDGISYARKLIGGTVVDYCEQSIIFKYLHDAPSYYTPARRAVTVAHELLHLYGAEDYYVSEMREAMARESYPRDIMLLDYTTLKSHEISAATAFSIGWTSEAPDLFLEDAWWADGAY